MDIVEVKKLKVKLEADILELVKAFAETNGVHIESLELVTDKINFFDKSRPGFSLILDVKVKVVI